MTSAVPASQITQEMREKMPPTDDRRPLVVGIICFLWALSTIGVAMRFSVRLKRHIHGWEDWMIYLAWAVGILGIPGSVFTSRGGLGIHHIYLTQEGAEQMLKWAAIGQLQVVIGVGLVRMSVCLLILRLIDRTNRKTRWFLYGIMAVNFVVSIVGLFLIAFQCQPFEKRYRPSTPGTCFNVGTLTYSTRARGILGCILDFACVAAAFAVFRNLQVPRKVKYATIALMSLGVITAACSIGKAVTSEFRDPDFSWTQVSVYLWSGAEQYLGIFVACLPTARPFLLDLGEARVSLVRFISSKSRHSSSISEKTLSGDHDVELGEAERLSSSHSMYKA